jgi:D-alanyl-lipoteichoic acid acyltransferase DltB (MBOAT superfamily)
LSAKAIPHQVAAMTVTSLLFFLFAAVSAYLYHKLPARFRNAWLLLVSAAFIASYSWQFVLVLALFALVNYAIGLKMERVPAHMQAWSYAGLVFNLLFLFVLKYNNFYLPAFSKLLTQLGLLSAGETAAILVPIGLSFLTVQTISYILDLRNKRLHAETDLIKFGVYIFFFPKLLSGPIERARAFLPKLGKPLTVDTALLERSVALIVIGLFRKLAFADPLFHMIPADAFTSPLNYPGQNLVFWLLAYSFALYNDFAGYTSIIRGVSLWFGIELSSNFNLPYLSRNFTEFWSKWHISLSNWLRDYIFFPFSRALAKKGQKFSRIFNLVLPPMVTMLVSGLWHGLAWNLLLWGGLHGVYQVIERLPSLWSKVTPLNERPKWRQHLGTGITFVFASLAWVPFHTNLASTLQYWQGLFLWKMPDLKSLVLTVAGKDLFSSWSKFLLPSPLLIGVILFAILFDWLQLRGKREEFILDWKRAALILFIVILLALCVLAGLSDQITPFVYQAF